MFRRCSVALATALLAVGLAVSPATAVPTGGSGGPATDRTFLSHSNGQYSSQYHLYAAGLDWSKPVGLLVYADGSGEYGLKNPSSSYLLGGPSGMVAVAKKHNMVLLTPLSPNPACSDGGGSCWYMGDPGGYVKWAEALVAKVQAQYPIEKDRVAFGGYSSGAQLATEFWVPSGAAQRTMTDGVVVAISYGGAPKVPQVGYTDSFRSNVHLNWNTGDQDVAYTTTGSFGVKAGHGHFTKSGFQTSLDVIAGLGHGRGGQFGRVMDAQITEHVARASAPAGTTPTSAPTPPTTVVPAAPTTVVPTTPTTARPVPAPVPSTIVRAPWQHSVEPTKVGARFTVKIPTGSRPTTVRVSPDFAKSSGWYLRHSATGTQTFDFTSYARLTPGSRYQYRIESGVAGDVVAAGTLTTLR